MDEPTTGRSPTSSGYVRVVGTTTLEVVNAAQRPDDVTKAVKTKWAVMAFVGNRKRLVGAFDRKYDAIGALLSEETTLKAAATTDDA